MASPKDTRDFNELWRKISRSSGTVNPTDFPFDLFNSGLNGVPGSTTENMTLYVDSTTGNDSNPGTQAQPFKQIQAALNSVPKNIKHLVDINIAAGTYAGFELSSFNLILNSNPSGVALRLNGTLSTATVATGTATGTSTAVTVGSLGASSMTFATLTDSGQSWTVNDLRGKFLEITSGSAAGVVYPISSNTATAITITSVTWGLATPVAGATYAIRDCGTIVSGTVLTPAATFTGAQASLTCNAYIYGCTAPAITQSIVFSNIKFTSTTATALRIDSQCSMALNQCVIAQNGNSTTNALSLSDSACGTFILNKTVVSSAGAAMFVTGTSNRNGGTVSATSLLIMYTGASASAPIISINNGAFRSSAVHVIGPSSSIGVGVLFQTAGRLYNAGGLLIESVATGMSVSDGGSYPIMGANVQCVHGIAGNVGITITNCTNGLVFGGMNFFGSGGGYVNISSCTNGIIASRGARIQLSSVSSMTTVTNEITIDSAAPVTLASMRAASPKLLKDANYLTTVYE